MLLRFAFFAATFFTELLATVFVCAVDAKELGTLITNMKRESATTVGNRPAAGRKGEGEVLTVASTAEVCWGNQS